MLSQIAPLLPFKIASGLPSNKNRSYLVHSLIKHLGILDSDASSRQLTGGDEVAMVRVVRPELASVQDLCHYHSSDYVECVLNLEKSADEDGKATSLSNRTAEFGLEDDCPPFPGLDRYVKAVAGASLTAAELLKSGRLKVAICWDGGRHHAQRSRAAGFCYVNDCILAILALKRGPPRPRATSGPPGEINESPRRARVMYLDLDLHYSDAVSECFYNPPATRTSRLARATAPQVLTLSVHYAAPGFYPATPRAALPNPTADDESELFDPFTLSLPLKQGASTRTFSRIWRSVVERVKDVFAPDYVVLQCGTDGLAGDPHAIWNWSLGAGKEGTMDWCVGQVVEEWGCRVLLLGGGGYNSPNAARAWACITSIARGKPLSPDTAIPDHPVFPMYAPSFTLEVAEGNMRDENSDEYLKQVEECYNAVFERLQERCRE